jgi:hypothetical protein
MSIGGVAGVSREVVAELERCGILRVSGNRTPVTRLPVVKETGGEPSGSYDNRIMRYECICNAKTACDTPRAPHRRKIKWRKA